MNQTEIVAQLIPIVLTYDLLALKRCNQSVGYSIHGLWPQWDKDDWPQFCNESAVFEPAKLAPWRQLMDRDWYACYGSSEGFWAHEWDKHGTCSGLEQEAYFVATLLLYYNFPWQQRCNDSLQCLVKVT